MSVFFPDPIRHIFREHMLVERIHLQSDCVNGTVTPLWAMPMNKPVSPYTFHAVKAAKLILSPLWALIVTICLLDRVQSVILESIEAAVLPTHTHTQTNAVIHDHIPPPPLAGYSSTAVLSTNTLLRPPCKYTSAHCYPDGVETEWDNSSIEELSVTGYVCVKVCI